MSELHNCCGKKWVNSFFEQLRDLLTLAFEGNAKTDC
jgi:hypothetical protein